MPLHCLFNLSFCIFTSWIQADGARLARKTDEVMDALLLLLGVPRPALLPSAFVNRPAFLEHGENSLDVAAIFMGGRRAYARSSINGSGNGCKRTEEEDEDDEDGHEESEDDKNEELAGEDNRLRDCDETSTALQSTSSSASGTLSQEDVEQEQEMFPQRVMGSDRELAVFVNNFTTHDEEDELAVNADDSGALPMPLSSTSVLSSQLSNPISVKEKMPHEAPPSLPWPSV